MGCKANAMAWQDSAWAQPVGWHTGETVPSKKQRRDCSASCFLHPTQPASSVTGGFSATNFTPIHAIHTISCNKTTILVGCCTALRLFRQHWLGRKKKRKHLCINTNVLGPQRHQMGDQDQALCSMDIASLCPWQFLALFT